MHIDVSIFKYAPVDFTLSNIHLENWLPVVTKIS